jgi:ATP/maltotriose-dependent transcriptional regulator MalT/DNA-binding SARP family transcriptional activator
MTEHPHTLAKLTRPHLGGILPRDRLYKRLDQGRERSIIWVAGPPGSGKTTLVADYLDTWAPECIWYEVDPGDADVATFFYYMAQALPESTDGEERSPLPLFTTEYQNNLPAFTRRYFRELFARLTPPFALVFDNYQEVPSQSRLHEVLRHGLEELPAGGCVTFISRRDPPRSMARFRANQRMEVIDPDDLKLTRDESAALAQLRRPDLDDAALEKLYEKTQGWAAGLVLLLGRSEGQVPMTDVPQDVLPQVVFDYLAGELFDDLDSHTHDLLLKTAWFQQFTGAMAAEISGHPDSDSVLSQLTREDYFVTARHSESDTVYQYHPLLREFLLSRAEEELSTRDRTQLRARVADMLEEAGQIEETVELRVTSRDWDALMRIIRERAETMLAQGRGETLERWLDALPPRRRQASPWMLYWLASCRLPTAPRESRRLFEQAYELFRAESTPDLTGVLLAMAGAMYAILNDLDDMTLLDRWITEALELTSEIDAFPSLEVEARVTAYTFMSMVFRQPSHPRIEAWGERTAVLMQADLSHKRQAEVTLIVTAATVWTGRFHQTESALQTMRALLGRPDIPLVMHATLFSIEAMYYALTGDYKECMTAVDRGIELAETKGVRLWRNRTLVFGIGGALGAGDLDKANELSQLMDKEALARNSFDSCIYNYFGGWQAMLEKDALRAYQLVRTSLRIAREIGLPFFELLCGLSLGHVLIACGDVPKARRTLTEIRDIGRRIQNRLLEFMSFLTFAEISLIAGRPRYGRNALRYALGLGREKGYMHTLWWQPEEMAKLCAYALEEGIEVDYVRSLIRQRGLVPAQASLHIDAWPWRFRVETLGRFSVTRDGADNLLSGRSQGRPLEVLKVAIAMGGRNTSVDRITDALWPNIDRDYAHRSFNTTLHRLRKLLGDEGAVILSNNELTLSDKFFWIDTWALDQSLDELQQSLRGLSADADGLGQISERILGLYQGSFLPSDEDNAWTISSRDQYRRKFMRFINDVGHWWEDHDQPEKALELYYRGLEVDPLAEGIYQRLMLCCQQTGRQAEAIDTYNRCCKTLEAELSAEPSRETREIYASLTRRTSEKDTE